MVAPTNTAFPHRSCRSQQRRCCSDQAWRFSDSLDADRLSSRGRTFSGKSINKLTRDAKLQADGKADKAEGEVQNAIGGVKRAVRDSVKT